MACQRGVGVAFVTILALIIGVVLVIAPATAQAPDPAPGSTGAVDDAAVIAFINEQIERGWKENGITPSKAATDHEWLRRAHLDIVGRIPTVAEINNYMKRSADTRRKEEIKLLLKDEDYAKNWANLWTVWLLTRTSPPGIDRQKMRLWLEEQFATKRAYNEMVKDLLTATGKADENGAANFVLSHFGERVPAEKRSEEGQFEMVPITSRTTKLFLAVQTQCVQCHDHPFIDSRKQGGYWGINTFFRQVTRTPEMIQMRRQDTQGQKYTLSDDLNANPGGGVYYEKRNGLLLMSTPVYTYYTIGIENKDDESQKGKKKEERIEPSSQLNRRQKLAELLTKDENFSRAIVNRMWGHFMGRGFTNPIDDFGEHNPVSHPELLDGLARYFSASGYDLPRLITWITSSKPYHLSSVANDTNKKSDAEPYFSRMLLKAMTPEQLVDSIFTATNAERTKSTKEEREKMYDDWLRDFTVNFGDDEGNEATFNGTVVQALLLMNGTKLNEAIRKTKGGTVDEASRLRNSTAAINRLYLSALNRMPTGQEMSVANRMMPTGTRDVRNSLEDILWALINSNEFILNH